MWLEERHGVNLRNHTTGEVFVDRLFQKSLSVNNLTVFIFITLTLYRAYEEKKNRLRCNNKASICMIKLIIKRTNGCL